jgi:plastocyanin
MRRLIAGVIAVAALAAPGAAGATTAEVGANGNVFTGGLSFTPAKVSLTVGDSVRWRNTDNVVPHTATEDHGLWDLAGSYGATPANPSGFGPGETRQRVFEAGTQSYYCRVHPAQMHGTVQVAPTLALQRVRVRIRRKKKPARKTEALAARKKKRKHKRRRPKTKLISYGVAVWASASPANGLAFDVERARPGGGWVPLRTGTQETNARFRIARGSTWLVRARLRSASDAARATGWSPAVSVTG